MNREREGNNERPGKQVDYRVLGLAAELAQRNVDPSALAKGLAVFGDPLTATLVKQIGERVKKEVKNGENT